MADEAAAQTIETGISSAAKELPEPLVGASSTPQEEEAGSETQEASSITKETSSTAKESGEGEASSTTKEEEKPVTKAPEEYAEFTLPEGTALDEQSATEFKGLARELDLTQEQAQKLLDFGGGKLRAMAEAPYKLWAETQSKWQAEVKSDPEIGGTKFEDSVRTAAEVFKPGESNPFVKDAKEAQALREAMNMTGAGNNPAIVKLFVKMGNILKEPASLSGNPVKGTAESLLAQMYPTMKSEG